MTTATSVAVGKKTAAAWGNAVKADLDDLYSVTTDSTIGTAGSGWSVNSGTLARTMLGGKLVYVHLYLQRTAALTVSGGNISPDETVFTLDAAYRPSEITNGVVGTGGQTGEAIVGASGDVSFRSMSDSVGAAANYRFTFSFMTP